MSEFDPPPPTPGTTPLLRREDVPSLRPYREHPRIAAEDRGSGRLTHTEQARIARIDAVARDLAAAEPSGPEPLRPAVGAEMIAAMEANLARELRAQSEARARGEASRRTAQLGVEAAEHETRENERDVRAARAAMPARPPGGTHFTHWSVPFAIGVVLGYLELELGAPALAPALNVSMGQAQLIAIGIAAAITLAGDVLGLVLGSLVERSRPQSTALLSGLVLLVTGLGAVTVVTLASARANNLAYGNCNKQLEEAVSAGLAQNSGGGLSALMRRGARRSQLETENRARANQRQKTIEGACKKLKPDLSFTIPLTLLAMFSSTLLASRVALASTWREARGRVKRAVKSHESSRAQRAGAQSATPAAELGLDGSDRDLGAAAEREVTTTEMLFERLPTEYRRWCAHFGHPPCDLILPEVPTAEEVLLRMLGLQPEDGRAAAPAAGAEPPPQPSRGPDPAREDEPNPPSDPPREPFGDGDTSSSPPSGPDWRPSDEWARTRERDSHNGAGEHANGDGETDRPRATSPSDPDDRFAEDRAPGWEWEPVDDGHPAGWARDDENG